MKAVTIIRSQRLRGIGGAVFLASIFLVCVTWNRGHVLVPQADGGTLVVLADGDCHSRLQRAAMVAAKPGTIIRSHNFENYPHGTVPHTTAPMDYLIAGLSVVIRPLDLAGAWISPLLGLFTVLFLFFWARGLDLRPRWPMLLLFCISPALTHAFALGRPDHQSLLGALTTAALAANWAWVKTAKSSWAWISGAAWGIALWVSWFEPLILLAAQEIARGLVLRRDAWPKPWRRALILAAGIALGCWAMEGFHNPWPSPEVRALFPRWAAMLGELFSTNPRAMFSWTGWLLAPAPLLLAWDYFRRRDPLAIIALLMLAAATALTGWQARWSLWQASIFCLALPWMLAPLRKGWLVWTVFIISLWPVAQAWELLIFPSAAEASRREELVAEVSLLSQTARFLHDQPRGGVLAPWWISPALARMSGQPMVGGTSHQSLPGTAETARFFLSDDDDQAYAILQKRMVGYVVTDAPERIIPTSAALLGTMAPAQPMIVRLARGLNIPPFLEPVFANRFFRVYKVRHE
jgi:hypothetical protein